jgi:hypothetical protein
MTEEEGEEFRRVAKLQYQEIEKLRAIIRWKDQELGRKDAELDGLISWIAGDADALAGLRSIYADPRQNLANKIKAAGLALSFERAKPAATVNTTFKLFDFLEAHRLKEQAAKTIEHQPKLEPGTVLGGPPEEGWDPNDPGHEGEGEADPAA